MTMREAGVFVCTVTVLLFADVILRAILGGYDAARIGGFDVALAIGTTIILMTRTGLGQIAER